MRVAVVILALLPNSLAYPSTHRAGMLVHEWVAVGALTLMPSVVIVVSRYSTHAFVPRYALWAVIGFALLVAALLCKSVRGQAAVGVTLLGVLLVGVALYAICYPGGNTPYLRAAEAVRQELEILADGPEAIVIPDSNVFMELSYYEKPRLRERLVYPISSDLDVHYRGYDTDALIISSLSRRTKLHAKEFAEIRAEYHRFFLAATASDYLPWHLWLFGFMMLGDLLLVEQAAIGDCPSFDPFAFDQNGLASRRVVCMGRSCRDLADARTDECAWVQALVR
jgi:hypothetical protein